ncbi:MAG: SDR family oxidoreductase [Terracoccus sp.]
MSVVIVTGATGATGRATCAALVAAGHHVAAVDRDAAGLAAVSDEIASTSAGDALTTHTCDLTDVTATATAVNEIRTAHGGIDGLVHLVGGWRGGATFTENLDEDWLLLRSLLVDTLRNTTLAVHDDLAASDAGRVVVITAASVETPTAGNANYAAAKAAGEAWILALADSFRSLQSGHAESPTTQRAAAVTAVVNYIGTGRTATTPARLAESICEIIDGDAAALNGARVDLRPDATR